MVYALYLTKKAQKDKKLLKAAGLDVKAKALLNLIAENPYGTPPTFEKLSGDLKGLYSRRINVQHRLVYEVDDREQTVKILSMWSHYGDN